MYQLKVNEQYEYQMKRDSDGLLINNEAVAANIKYLNATAMHVIKNLKSYNVEVINFNKTEKTAEIKVNNNIYTVSAKDQFDILLDKLGLGSLNGTHISEIKAPMPGLVLKV